MHNNLSFLFENEMLDENPILMLMYVQGFNIPKIII
jgi:hypothetical protein